MDTRTPQLPRPCRVPPQKIKIVGKEKGNSTYCTEKASSAGRGGRVRYGRCRCPEQVSGAGVREQGGGPGGQWGVAGAGSARAPLVGSAGRRAKGPGDNASALLARRRLCFWVLTVLRPRKRIPDAGGDGSCTYDKTVTVPTQAAEAPGRPLAAARCGGHTCSQEGPGAFISFSG